MYVRSGRDTFGVAFFDILKSGAYCVLRDMEGGEFCTRGARPLPMAK
jgi:hypothetical protein